MRVKLDYPVEKRYAPPSTKVNTFFHWAAIIVFRGDTGTAEMYGPHSTGRGTAPWFALMNNAALAHPEVSPRRRGGRRRNGGISYPF